MSKIIGLLIIVAAFFAAVIYLLLRKDPRMTITPATSKIKRRFLITVGIISAFLCTGTACNAGDKTIQPGNHMNAQTMQNTQEWQGIKTNWNQIDVLKINNMDELDDVLKKKKKENEKLFGKLIQANVISKDAAVVVNEVYLNRVFHQFRSKLATCYVAYPVEGTIRNDVEKRFEVLNQIKSKSNVDFKTLEQAKINLANDMDLIAQYHYAFNVTEEQKYDEKKYMEGYAAIQAYLNKIKNNETPAMPSSEAVKQALIFIQSLYE